MGCCGERQKFENPENEQKWDYINLSDFRSSSCLTPLSYGILYIVLLISVAVYAVDLFTCVNLLFFDKWSGQVKPAIPFEISRWIFTGCIILSYVLLAFRWWRAIRAMKTGVVAASYLDPLAVRVQSVRVGASGRGWRRFLVFAELTKGRKGAEYVALFSYFSFEAWLRICFAEGPRQVINALTLYSVMQADLVPTGQHAAPQDHSPVAQFFVNVQLLAGKNREQAVILFGMLFTLVIWVFSALSLLLAVVFYLTFLWHHIRDGSLSRYCRRKIDSRLHKIVMVKVNKALEKDTRGRPKQQPGGLGAGILQTDFKRQPTLPVLNTEGQSDIKPLSRQTTDVDTAAFPTRPPTSVPSNVSQTLSREPTVPDVFSSVPRPHLPSRSTTQNSRQSTNSYADDAPLINSAAPPGHSHPSSRRGPSRAESENTLPNYKHPARSMTGTSQGVPLTSQPNRPPPQNTGLGGGRTAPWPQPTYPQSRRPIPPGNPFNPGAGRPPGPPRPHRNSTLEYEMQPQPSVNRINGPPNNDGYVAFNPGVQNPSAPSVPSAGRNFTQPQTQSTQDYFEGNPPPQRSGTAPIPFGPSNGGSWRPPQAGSVPYRSATAGPGGHGQRRPMPPRY